MLGSDVYRRQILTSEVDPRVVVTITLNQLKTCKYFFAFHIFVIIITRSLVVGFFAGRDSQFGPDIDCNLKVRVEIPFGPHVNVCHCGCA